MDRKAEGLLFLILTLFVVHSVSMNFTQDDAFISYRYVKNSVKGQGLVFNPGERVEGYTHFLWIILLSLFVSFGLNVMLASKILGITSGGITLILLYKIAILVLPKSTRSRSFVKDKKHATQTLGKKGSSPNWLFALIPPFLVAANSAFAYWSISGLETSFFVMAVLLSVYFYFTKEKLMILSSALSSLIRPEGVLVFAIILAHKFLFKKDSLKACLSYMLGFVLLLLPHLIFKISYYGDLLPQSFLCKNRPIVGICKYRLWLYLALHQALWFVGRSLSDTYRLL